MEVSVAAPGPPRHDPSSFSEMMIQAEDLVSLDPDTAKQQQQTSSTKTKVYGALAGINHLEKLQPAAALTLHAFADNFQRPSPPGRDGLHLGAQGG